MTNSSELYKPIFDKLGPLVGAEALPESKVASYRGHIPGTFIDFIKPQGFGMWLNGYWQFCDPKNYAPLASLIFGHDAEFKASETHILGFSAFGSLLAWNEKYQVVRVFIFNHSVSSIAYFNPTKNYHSDATLAIAIDQADHGVNDPGDDDGNPLFKRCLKALGPIELGQMYAPILPPAAGGSWTIDNIQIGDALVSMLIMAQWSRFKIVNSGVIPPKIIRDIG